MSSRPFGPAHRDLFLHLQDHARSTIPRQVLLLNAWRRHAMGKFWSHPLVDGSRAAFTTGTLGWVAKATPIRLFHRMPARDQATALFDGGRLWVHSQWLDEQFAESANDPQALGRLLEQGLRANARLALGMEIGDTGPWQVVSKSEVFYLRAGSLEPFHGDNSDHHNVTQALQWAQELQPPSHGIGWEEELARAASMPVHSQGQGEWQLWREVLDEGLARRGHEAPMDPKTPWLTELLTLRARVADRPVDHTTPDAMAELLEAMVATRGGSNVEAVDEEHANHACFQARQIPPLSDTPFAFLLQDPEHAALRTSVCLEAWRAAVNHSNECFDSPIQVDTGTGMPPIQATDYLETNLLAHAAMAAMAQGQWLSSPQATGAYPWVHRFTYVYEPGGKAYSHPWAGAGALAKAWGERPRAQREPQLLPHPGQGDKRGERPSWLLDQWVANSGRDIEALWWLWKSGANHALDKDRWWNLFASFHKVGNRDIHRFLTDNPGWLEPGDACLERAMNLISPRKSFPAAARQAVWWAEDTVHRNQRLLLLQALGCDAQVWWACVEKHLDTTEAPGSIDVVKKVFRVALERFEGEPPSTDFLQADVVPIFQEARASYKSKRLKKQKGPGSSQTPTRPRL